ncbi:catechol 1,2-dioxygenase [Kyrpidia spormannii]|nr:catechol 1,2-dioxygenase [Kyrpidia spormannii]
MGTIVGAGLVSHVPTIMLPEQERRALNAGRETTLVTGLVDIRNNILEDLDVDTLVIFDSHWHTTFDFVVDGREHFSGLYTSDELPRSFHDWPYEYRGDPELADLIAEMAAKTSGAWVYVSRSPALPVHYGTINLVHYLCRGEKVLSVSLPYSGETDDFLTFGALLREAVEDSDRRVVLLASGGLSHRFWPLGVIREHEASGLEHIVSPEARAIDERIIGLLVEGRHADVIELMPEFSAFAPEGGFGHYLMMVGALGGRSCNIKGKKFSEYEASVGTGQIHIWFEV